jgi:uncharacterized protein YceK
MLSGCGTLVTQFDETERYTFPGYRQRTVPQIYSGTAADLVYTKDIIVGTTGVSVTEQPSECCFSPFYLILDFPLSLVADTLLLPYTIPKQIRHGNISKSAPPSPLLSNGNKVNTEKREKKNRHFYKKDPP